MRKNEPVMEMATLEERDRILERLWAELEDVPMNPDTECLEAPFLHFPCGTERRDIWGWFGQRYSKGLAYLLHAVTEPALVEKEGVCPVCGAQIEYDGEYEILDNGGVIAWVCPNCGTTGKEGYDHIFDRHYNVYTADGEPVSK